MSFDGDIAEFEAKVRRKAVAVYQLSTFEVFNRLVKRTPVDTGRLRGNWKMTPVTFNLGGNTLISNDLPYAGAIEDGHSKQAPNGMVRITALEFKRIVKEFVKKVN